MRNISIFGAAVVLASAVTMSGLIAAPHLTPASTASYEPAAASYRDVTLPAGTTIAIALDTALGSDLNRVEDVVQAHTRHAIVVRGVTAIPAGSTLVGHVTSVKRPGRVKGRGYISFRFNRLDVENQRVTVRTSAVGRTAPSGKSDDVKTIAIPAAGGAIIGAIAGGKKGAAIGAAVGGGGGTAAALATRGPDVRVRRGALATVRLVEPVTIRVRE